jgi:hypothetical protein
MSRLKMERESKKTLTEIIINNKKELTMKERKKTLGYNQPKQRKKTNHSSILEC